MLPFCQGSGVLLGCWCQETASADVVPSPLASRCSWSQWAGPPCCHLESCTTTPCDNTQYPVYWWWEQSRMERERKRESQKLYKIEGQRKRNQLISRVFVFVLCFTCSDWAERYWGNSCLTAAASPGTHCKRTGSRRRSRWSPLAPPAAGEWMRGWTGYLQSGKRKRHIIRRIIIAVRSDSSPPHWLLYLTTSEDVYSIYLRCGSVTDPFPPVLAR